MNEYVTVVAVDDEDDQKGKSNGAVVNRGSSAVDDRTRSIKSINNSQSQFITVLSINDSDINLPAKDKAPGGPTTEEILVYRSSGERLGFGLKFQGGTRNNEKIQRLFIQSCAANSPASRCSASWGPLREGDEILEIDGADVKKMTRIECVKCLKDSNDAIKLLVRNGEGKVIHEFEEHYNELNEKKIPLLPPQPPTVPPRKLNKRKMANGSSEAQQQHLQQNADSKIIIHSNSNSFSSNYVNNGRNDANFTPPPDAEYYLNLFSTENEMNSYNEIESDDTSSTISTVFDKFSICSSLSSESDLTSCVVGTNLGGKSSIDLAKVLKPFTLLEKEFNVSNNDTDTRTATKIDECLLNLQPPVNFQDDLNVKSDAIEYENVDVDAGKMREQVGRKSLYQNVELGLDKRDVNANYENVDFKAKDEKSVYEDVEVRMPPTPLPRAQVSVTVEPKKSSHIPLVIPRKTPGKTNGTASMEPIEFNTIQSWLHDATEVVQECAIRPTDAKVIDSLATKAAATAGKTAAAVADEEHLPRLIEFVPKKDETQEINNNDQKITVKKCIKITSSNNHHIDNDDYDDDEDDDEDDDDDEEEEAYVDSSSSDDENEEKVYEPAQMERNGHFDNYNDEEGEKLGPPELLAGSGPSEAYFNLHWSSSMLPTIGEVEEEFSSLEPQQNGPIVIIDTAEELGDMLEPIESAGADQTPTVCSSKMVATTADTDSIAIKTNSNDKIMISVSTSADNTDIVKADRHLLKLNGTVSDVDIHHNDINYEIESKQQLNNINNNNSDIINKMSEINSENVVLESADTTDGISEQTSAVGADIRSSELEVESVIVAGTSETSVTALPDVKSAAVEESANAATDDDAAAAVAEPQNVRIVLGNDNESPTSSGDMEEANNENDESVMTIVAISADSTDPAPEMDVNSKTKTIGATATESSEHVSPPAFYRLPPDGHEFPPNFIEPSDGLSSPASRMDSAEAKSFNSKMTESSKPPAPPRKMYRQDIIIKMEEAAVPATKPPFKATVSNSFVEKSSNGGGGHSFIEERRRSFDLEQIKFKKSDEFSFAKQTAGTSPASAHYGKSSSMNWRKDEKSEKSVRDKIAMFSKENVVDKESNGNAASAKYTGAIRKSVSVMESSSSLSAGGMLSPKVLASPAAKYSMPFKSSADGYGAVQVKAQSVEYLDEIDKSDNKLNNNSSSCSSSSSDSKSKQDSIRFERALSVDDLNQEPATNAFVSLSSNTLPRKASNQLLARTTSFSGYTNTNVEENRRSSINNLLEQRRKSMSKLRGLVIPDKVSETDASKVLGMPVIRSKDSERITASRASGLPKIVEATNPAAIVLRKVPVFAAPTAARREVRSTNSVDYIPSYQRSNFVNSNGKSLAADAVPLKAAVRSDKHQPGREGKSEVFDKPMPTTVPPMKPPRTSLILVPTRSTLESNSKTMNTDESDSDSPQSPIISSLTVKRNLIRTLSSETNTSVTSTNSTLTSGSGSQASCSSFGSTPTIDMSRKLNRTVSNELTVNRKIILASAKFRSGRDDIKTGEQKWYEDGDSTDGYEEEDRRRFTSKSKQRNVSNGNANEAAANAAPEKEMIHYNLANANDSLVDKEIKIASYVEIVSDSEELLPGDEDLTVVDGRLLSQLPQSAVPVAVPAPDAIAFKPVETKLASVKGKAESITPIVEAQPAEEKVIPKKSFELNYTKAAVVEKKSSETEAKPTSHVRESRLAAENKKLTLSDIRKKFENKTVAVPPTPPAKQQPSKESKIISHDRFSSWDSLASSSSSVSSLRNNSYIPSSQISAGSMHTLPPSTPSDYGSFSSLGSSHSLITPQDLQFIIEEADPPLETPDAFVVVLQRDTPESSIGITLAGGSDYETKEITIHKILTNSPAEKDGRLKRSDRILSINGLSMRGLTHRESLTVLKTPRLEVVMVATRAKSVIPQLLSKTKRASLGSLGSLAERSSENGEYERKSSVISQKTTSIDMDIETISNEDHLNSDDSGAAMNATTANKTKNPQSTDAASASSCRTVQIYKDSAGLGFSIEGGYDSPKGDQPLVVKKIFMGGSAEKSGKIKAGDEIVAINDTPVEKMTRIEVWNMMKRLPQDFVNIKFK